MNIEPWFSVDEIAKYLRVSRASIYRWLDKTNISAYHRIGKLWKFKPFKIDEWVGSSGADRTKEARSTSQTEVSL